MAGLSIKNLDVDALLTLRADIDKRLTEKRRELETQLSRLAAEGGRARRVGAKAAGLAVGGRTSAMKGRTVPPKYRGPDGETWAGRGAQPRWLAAAIKEGKTKEDFLIAPEERKQARKTRGKKQKAD